MSDHPHQKPNFDPALSVYLDALRFLSALVVVVAHAFVMRFHGGDQHVIMGFNFGLDAVMVFFVLSGFVIAHAADGRSAEQFVFARLTRLWSVAVPAVILTFALDRMGLAMNPAAYSSAHYNALEFGGYLFYGLTFASQWTFWGEHIGTNGPLWSLSYEAAFYALFAVATYTGGLRRAALLAVGVGLFGLNVLLLMPAWLAGVAAYRLTRQDLPGSRWIWAGLATLPFMAYAYVIAFGHPTAVREPFGDFGMSDHFVWNNFLALLVAVHIVAMAKLIKGIQVGPARAVRYLAGASFSIYVVHLPAMHFGWAVTGLTGPAFMLTIVPATLLACFLFAAVFERPLPRFRRGLKAVLGQRRFRRSDA